MSRPAQRATLALPKARHVFGWAMIATMMSATVASAHPGLRPGEVAAGATTEAEVVVPHGCGTEGGMPEEDAEASATTQVALEWPDDIEVQPEPIDGWTTDVDDGVTTWDDDGGATTDPIMLPVAVTVADDVAPGEVYAAVYQECANGESFRWQALPDEDGSPALGLTVVAGGDGAGGGSTTATASPGVGAPEPTSEPTSEPATASTDTAGGEATATAVAAPVDDEDSGLSPWLVAALLVVVVGAGAIWWNRRERTADTPAEGDDR